MTRLVWDELAARRYHAGVSRGVLYPPTQVAGVAWSGLISVEEATDGGEKAEYHYDGRKFLDETGGREFQGRLQAFSAPRLFKPCLGEIEIVPGFVLTRQPRQPFGLCYRTEIEPYGYRLNLLYNVTATPQGRSYQTASATVNTTPMDLQLNVVPEPSTTHKPTGHYTIDSTKVSEEKMDEVEWLLYGTPNASPILPYPDDLVSLLNS